MLLLARVHMSMVLCHTAVNKRLAVVTDVCMIPCCQHSAAAWHMHYRPNSVGVNIAIAALVQKHQQDFCALSLHAGHA